MTDIAPDHLLLRQRLLAVLLCPVVVIEKWPVVVEEGPQQVGHREGDMLPVAVGKDMTATPTAS